MRDFTLHTKTALLIGFVVVLVALGTLVVVGWLQLSELDSELDEKGRAIAASVAELIVEDVINQDRLTVHRALTDMVDRTHDVVYAYVRDFDGAVLAHTFEQGFPALFDSHNQDSIDDHGTDTRLYKLDGMPIVDVSYSLIEGLRSDLHLGLDQWHTRSHVRKQMARLAVWFLMIAVGATALGVLGARQTARPFALLSRHIEAYGRQQAFDLPETSIRGVEAKRLASACRAMVADRDRATRDLQASERRFRQMAEAMHEVYWLFDWRKQRVAYVNPAFKAVWGLKEDDVYSDYARWVESVHPEDRAAVDEALVRLVETGRPESLEYRIVRPDGEVRWISDRASVITGDDGEVSHVVGIASDITEKNRDERKRKQFEAQLQQAQKLESLGVLAGGIAHDFNNLLTGVLGNADLASTHLSETSPARDYVNEIEVAARRAADLANQLLAYSGKGRFVVKPIDLSTVVQEMEHLVRMSLRHKTVIEYQLGKDLPAIEADATQVRQIALNLITNASEAIASSGGLISVRTGAMDCDERYLNRTIPGTGAKPGTYCFVEVSDSGMGIDQETVTRIFDPFFTTKARGRGLGLSAVLGIVRGHSGAVEVISEPGSGTTIRALFPASEAAAVNVDFVAQRMPSWRGKGLVLVVDDEDAVRDVVRRMLGEFGFEVLTAADGREALTVYEAHVDAVSLVLLDLTMPHLSGAETFGRLREIRPDVKIVLMSGYNEQDTTSRFAGQGLAGFIPKPIRMAALQKCLLEVLGDSNAESG